MTTAEKARAANQHCLDSIELLHVLKLASKGIEEENDANAIETFAKAIMERVTLASNILDELEEV